MAFKHFNGKEIGLYLPVEIVHVEFGIEAVASASKSWRGMKVCTFLQFVLITYCRSCSVPSIGRRLASHRIIRQDCYVMER